MLYNEEKLSTKKHVQSQHFNGSQWLKLNRHPSWNTEFHVWRTVAPVFLRSIVTFNTLRDPNAASVLARLELCVGNGSFTSVTWVFHYPYRAPNILQKSSPMQGRNFEFCWKSKGPYSLPLGVRSDLSQNWPPCCTDNVLLDWSIRLILTLLTR